MENLNEHVKGEIGLLIAYLEIESLIKEAPVTAGNIPDPNRKQAHLELMSRFDKEIDAYTTLTQEKDSHRRKIVSEIWKSRIQKRKEAFERYVR